MMGRRILITGNDGFLVDDLCQLLRHAGAQVMLPRDRRSRRGSAAAACALIRHHRPHTVIHLSPVKCREPVGRRGRRSCRCQSPLVGLELLEAARRYGAWKVVHVQHVSAVHQQSCSRCNGSRHLLTACRDAALAATAINPSLLRQASAYRRLFGVRLVTLLPTEMYGPRDSFHPSSGREIPSLIRNIITARFAAQRQLEIVGEPQAQRQYVFVRDVAEAILLAADRLEDEEPVPISTGETTTLRQLAATIAELCGFRGRIGWRHATTDSPSPQRVDPRLAEARLGFTARTLLEDGLAETVAWYWNKLAKENREYCGLRSSESCEGDLDNGLENEVSASTSWRGPRTR